LARKVNVQNIALNIKKRTLFKKGEFYGVIILPRVSIDKKIDELSKKFDDFKKSATKVEKDAEKRIQEHPMQSMAMAFGAGAVVGAVIVALMRGKR
jgi:hypothetical protein